MPGNNNIVQSQSHDITRKREIKLVGKHSVEVTNLMVEKRVIVDGKKVRRLFM